MQLIKDHWTTSDVNQFEKYLLTLSRGSEKSAWEKRIVNTNLPCLAIPSPQIKALIKQIARGNFLEFLNLGLWNNFSEVNINGGLITRIDNFELMTQYLYPYLEKIDNWANCDSLKFKITPHNQDQYLALAEKLTQSPSTFTRRAGIIILLKLVNHDSYLPKIFCLLNNFTDEKEYYANMANAWLFAECFTKQRTATLNDFLPHHRLNKFTLNKGIQKCRDSYRVSPADKELLLQYKIK